MQDGFLGFSESDRISSMRGTPRVTFDLDATPAKWKVLSVHLCSRLSDALGSDDAHHLSRSDDSLLV